MRDLTPAPLDLHQVTLDNGLRVIVHRDPLTALAAVNLWYDVGSRDEEPGRTGFAHLFEHLMFQGSAHVAKGEHFSRLEGIGASLNASTWADRTNYFESVVVEHLELALWLEADRMGSLVVDQDNLDNQREVVKEEKRQRYDNQPAGSLWIDVHAALFDEGHPYHHSTIGSMQDLDAATLADVNNFHSTWYGPDNAVLTVVGDVDPDEVVRLADRYFGRIAPLGGTPAHPDGTVAQWPVRDPVRLAKPDRVSQPAVCAAWRVPPLDHPDHDAVQVAMAVLGRGRGSRLRKRLTTDASLALPSGSYCSAVGLIGQVSIGLARMDARDGVDAAQLVDALDTEIVRLGKQPPDEVELERAKALIATGWLHQLSDPTSRADQLSRLATLLGDPLAINRQLDRVLATTAQDVVRVAQDVLPLAGAPVITYLPGQAEEVAE